MAHKAVYVQAGGGFDKVVIGDCDAADPGPGEIQVRIRASSLNYHDYMVVKGITGPSEQRIPMADGAGEVTAVGTNVTDFAVGDAVVSTFFPDWLDGRATAAGFARVPGDGIDGYARELVTAPATAFTKSPASWRHAEAATLTTAGLTAWRALVEDGGIKAGDTVLVQGTGGVSIFALQFARMMGARVIATSSSEEKLQRLKDLGAEHVINYRQDSNWGETAAKLTGGRGVDHVIDVGGSATLDQSMQAVRVSGHIALIGILGGTTADLPIALALGKQVRLQGLIVGNRRQQQEMVRAIDANCMKPVIDRHFPLDEIVDAFRHQEGQKHFGKIVLDI